MEEILADMDKVTRRKERLRQYYLAHREKLLAASKLYNKNHPEKAKEYREHRRKHHPEREKEYRLRYYNKNKEKIAEKIKAWRSANPDKVKEYYRRQKIKRSEDAYAISKDVIVNGCPGSDKELEEL